MPIDDLAGAGHQERDAKAMGADALGDFVDMRGLQPSDLSRGHFQFVERTGLQPELGRKIVAPGGARGLAGITRFFWARLRLDRLFAPV